MRKTPLVSGGIAAVVVAAAVALPAEGATTSVSVKDNVFAPTSKTVKRNDTVRFVWRGRAPHNVVISGPRRASSKVQVKGTFSFRARTKGSYKVVCTIHPGMDMRLRVR